MFAARNIHYEMADRTRAIGYGGIGAVHLLARKIGLVEAIDRDLQLLKVHLPYFESDHVLNIAYNILCDGDCLADLERLRHDEGYLDALGASRIPDPTTAGDFCRRFESADRVVGLMETINRVRLEIWKGQPPEFFGRAILDADGTIAPTHGQCKAGMDISHDGQWGYHPLLVSLSNTKEPLYLLNRPANRPSHEQAWEYLDKSVALCRDAGFKSILMRGDTDFTQSGHLDRWDEEQVEFIFGIDAMPNLVQHAENLPESAWKPLDRPARYQVKTRERQRPPNVKEAVVRRREFENIRLLGEQVAEFAYQPTACRKIYRMIVVRKNLSVEKGESVLFDDVRYFFYITNEQGSSAPEIVFLANDRCDQENLIEQLKNGVHAMKLPVDNLISNWAYMVMASLAWTLKAWYGLLLPEASGRGAAGHAAARQRRCEQKRQIVRMEFKTFVANLVRLPCQIIRGGRRLTYRLLSYNPWQEVLLSGAAAWCTRRLC
jgi:Transposase DDE domain group 1